MPWKCFLIEPTALSRLSLRRFAYSGKRLVGNTTIGFKEVDKQCPRGKDYGHDVSVVIAEQVPDESGRHMGKQGFETDPRWPVKCASCDYVFDNSDEWGTGDPWQVNYDTLWKGSPDGKLYALRESPPGATWVADWFPDEGPNGEWTGPDGKVWCVMLPTGMEWIVYGHSSTGEGAQRQKGPKWTVQGTPPLITAHPSINQVGHWHGFIQTGVVSADCEGRKFPQWPDTA